MKSLVLAFSTFLLAIFGFFKTEKSTQLVDNQPTTKPEQPVELGQIHWLRDFEVAKTEAEKSKKPILILFQEVPGCSTCQRFGNQVLSHPLLVEAVETEFVPLCIFNNKGGADRAVLEKYGEPSWNNPVVRIMDEAGETDLVERISTDWSPHGLADGILSALKKRGKTPAVWLENLEKEARAAQSGLSEAIFSMPCFWTGEGKLGELEGVVATEPGFMDGREVVKVKYDATAISFETLLKKADETGCAGRVFCSEKGEKAAAEKAVGAEKVAEKGTFRPDREPKYYLLQTTWRHVPMTEMQAARANALIGNGRSPETVLSPRQIELKKIIDQNEGRKWPNAVSEKDFFKAWAAAEKVRNGA